MCLLLLLHPGAGAESGRSLPESPGFLCNYYSVSHFAARLEAPPTFTNFRSKVLFLKQLMGVLGMGWKGDEFAGKTILEN